LYGVTANGHPLGTIQTASFTRDWAAELGGQWHLAYRRGFFNRTEQLEGFPYVLHCESHLELDGGRWLGLRRPLFKARLDFYVPFDDQPAGWLVVHHEFFSRPSLEAWLPDHVPPPATMLLILGELHYLADQQSAAAASSS
jgi:hypothetical protein